MEQVTKNLSVSDCEKLRAGPRATTGDLSDLDKELVNYVFHKIQTTWGDALYASHIGSEKDLAIKKRDWAKDLLTALNCRPQRIETPEEWAFRAKSRVDDIFTEIRHLQVHDRSWEFPSLKKVCGHMAGFRVHACHKPFRPDRSLEDQGKRERAKAAGAAELARMREMVGL